MLVVTVTYSHSKILFQFEQEQFSQVFCSINVSQSYPSPRSIMHRLMEVVGVVCNDENVVDCANSLCDLVGLRLSDPEEPVTSETLSLAAKVRRISKAR